MKVTKWKVWYSPLPIPPFSPIGVGGKVEDIHDTWRTGAWVSAHHDWLVREVWEVRCDTCIWVATGIAPPE
jgi:hypothetical protein